MKKGTFCLMLCLMLWAPREARGDIYMRIDSDGVIYFTNVPTTTGYELYIKEGNRGKSGSPMTFDGVIQKAAGKYGVDAHLVKAVIKVESDFNPRAVSRRGAKGLMQIMPSNFKTLSIRDPFNPLENVMAGTLYLKRLMKRYEKKLPLVLAAYNAGPQAVDRYRDIPPFPETLNYVRKVMTYYAAYKKS